MSEEGDISPAQRKRAMNEIMKILESVSFKTNEQAASFAADALSTGQPARSLISGTPSEIINFMDTAEVADLVKLHVALDALGEFTQVVGKLIAQAVTWRLANPDAQPILEMAKDREWEGFRNG